MNSPYLKTARLLRRLRARLKQRFSPSRLLRRSDGLVQLSEGGGGSEWVLARGLCAYTLLDGAAVPAAKRRAYAEMAIRRWSPFSDPGWHVEWVGQRAMVWAWSQDRVLASRDEEAPLAPPLRIVPESLLRGQAQPEGAELISLDEGVEGRIWRDHALVASAWWPQAPDAGEWSRLLRGAGMKPAPVPPAVASERLNDRPWSRTESRNWGEVASRHRSILAATGLALAAALVAVPLAGSLRLLAATSAVEGEIASQDESLQQILAARESAERDQAAIEALLALRPPAGQLQLLSTVIEAVPGSNWQMLEWRMPDPDTLELDLRMPRPDPRALVEAFEQTGQFRDVGVELSRSADEIGVRAGIVRRTPADATDADQ
ncbi:MAG: hypothetical protein KY442_12075 [Proteobacteria bacterium]|nr:hypothetical protein [Pseudomonadota bacterium]